jgi:acetylornithine deacetylase/succinyl-diaminopimelate desuccinylase-like protein
MRERPDTGESELLRALIRNACVNDGTASSGGEVRNALTLRDALDGCGLDIELFEAAPGRVSLVARLDGTQPEAPGLCLMAHTDVVPVDPSGWTEDPFGGDLRKGEIWGRGAVDMLNFVASMAVAVRKFALSGRRPRGNLIFLAVADEESGGTYGSRWMAEHHWDDIKAPFVLTEGGGVHGGPPDSPTITCSVAERGVAWRRLTIEGTPGHGSMPYGVRNALVIAAEVVRRLAEYAPGGHAHELWVHHIANTNLDAKTRRDLLDPSSLDEALAGIEDKGLARHLHACSHTTLSPNAVHGSFKTNIIPGRVELDVDIRTLPGETSADVEAHLARALGDVASHVGVSELLTSEPTSSPVSTPLWDSLKRVVGGRFPTASLSPILHMGFTDARVFRDRGVVAYGSGLLSPTLLAGEFAKRFHGHDERIDVESLHLSTELFDGVVRDFLE